MLGACGALRARPSSVLHTRRSRVAQSGVIRRGPQTRVHAKRSTLSLPRSAEPSHTTRPTNSGAREAQTLSLPRSAERSNATLPTNSGARAAQHARAGRAGSSTAACPEPKRAKSLGRPDHDLPMRLGPRELTEQARAFPPLQRGRPSATVRACANESLEPRAEGAARPSRRNGTPNASILTDDLVFEQTALAVPLERDAQSV
jgi:hypothetical protein